MSPGKDGFKAPRLKRRDRRQRGVKKGEKSLGLGRGGLRDIEKRPENRPEKTHGTEPCLRIKKESLTSIEIQQARVDNQGKSKTEKGEKLVNRPREPWNRSRVGKTILRNSYTLCKLKRGHRSIIQRKTQDPQCRYKFLDR